MQKYHILLKMRLCHLQCKFKIYFAYTIEIHILGSSNKNPRVYGTCLSWYFVKNDIDTGSVPVPNNILSNIKYGITSPTRYEMCFVRFKSQSYFLKINLWINL